MLFVHSLFDFLVFSLQINKLFIRLSQFFLVHSHVIRLVSLNLLVLRICPVKLKFKVPIGNQKLIALIVQIMELFSIISLSLL